MFVVVLPTVIVSNSNQLARCWGTVMQNTVQNGSISARKKIILSLKVCSEARSIHNITSDIQGGMCVFAVCMVYNIASTLTITLWVPSAMHMVLLSLAPFFFFFFLLSYTSFNLVKILLSSLVCLQNTTNLFQQWQPPLERVLFTFVE